MSKNIFRSKFKNTRSYVVGGELVEREDFLKAREEGRSKSYSFHSKAEALRYLELAKLAAEDHIEALRLQPRYDLYINGLKVCTYVADFEYVEQKNGHSILVTEDVKGQKTPEYKIKSRMFHILYCSAGHRLFRETRKKRKEGFTIEDFPPPA